MPSSCGPGNLRIRYLQNGIQREVLVTEQTKPRLDLCPFPQRASDKIKRTLRIEKANLTSAANPDGQVRGQILPVPEPSAFALLLSGAGLAFFAMKRKAQ
jgi:hypothetical protein